MDHSIWPKYSFLGLLICLISVIVIAPFFMGNLYADLVMLAFISVVLISSTYIFSKKKRSLIIASSLAVPTLILNWARFFYTSPSTIIASKLLSLIFFGYIISILLWEVFKKKEITANLIYGSICIYLLIGLEWAFIFSLVDILQPGSFQASLLFEVGDATGQQISVHLMKFLYYSYVTLTTLGYGDITPVSPPAQLISTLESIFGQFYLTILVARLVGLHISNKTVS